MMPLSGRVTRFPMKVSNRIPAIYVSCRREFGVRWDDGVVLTYGDTAYCKYPLSPDLIVHESVHVRQQGDEPDKWWKQYLYDPDFRREQETEAYLAQADFLRKIPGHEVRLREIAGSMARMYGGIWTEDEAYELLTKKDEHAIHDTEGALQGGDCREGAEGSAVEA